MKFLFFSCNDFDRWNEFLWKYIKSLEMFYLSPFKKLSAIPSLWDILNEKGVYD